MGGNGVGPGGRAVSALDRRFAASLASTLAGDWGSAAGAEADDLFMRLANVMSNGDFLDLCRVWAVEPGTLRRLLTDGPVSDEVIRPVTNRNLFRETALLDI